MDLKEFGMVVAQDVGWSVLGMTYKVDKKALDC